MDIGTAYRAVQERGGALDLPLKIGGSKCLLFRTRDPDGNSVEIMEIPPESLQAQADKRFHDPLAAEQGKIIFDQRR